MKVSNYKILLLSLITILSACKKSDVLKPASKGNLVSESAQAADDGHLSLTVITIAGKAGADASNGYADGEGPQALFNIPMGIDLMDDGTLYIADTYNNKIRKITPPGVVSTVGFPNSSDGEALMQPSIVRVAKDGTLNVLERETPLVFNHKVWIFKPTGELITPKYHSEGYHYYDIARDPYVDTMKICGVQPIFVPGNILTGYDALLEKFQVDQNGEIGTDGFIPPKDSIVLEDQDKPFITAMFCGWNKVKYLIIGQHLYKYTPSGVFTQIYRDLDVGYINSIVATKDSRTLYIVAAGAIYSLSQGKIKYLVGPHNEFRGRDGVGVYADVNANALALSKDESTLYFTDYINSSVRKLLLR